MFRKIVSHLPFSPSLIHELGFYAKRLSKEEATRRMGLIVMALALVVQSFVLFNPPESANAAHPADLVHGGVWTGNQLLHAYDSNVNGYKDLLTALGITRNEIYAATTKQQTLSSTSGYYSWALTPQFSASQGERTFPVKLSNGNIRNYYYYPHNLWGAFTYGAFVGHSAKFGWFAIMKNCGNLISPKAPPAPACPPGQIGKYPHCTVPPKKCTVPGKTHLPEKDPGCKHTPLATCSSLTIINNGGRYQLTGTAKAEHGAKILGYTFKVYREGKLIATLKSNTDTAYYTQTQEGSYKVTLTVITSLGEKTAESCEKTFIIPSPKKCALNPSLKEEDPRCQPCPGDPTLWIEDKKCTASFIELKSATNLTQNNIDASKTTAKAHDRITYHLRVTNKGLAPAEYTFKEYLTDVLDYSNVFDTGGGEVVDNPDASSKQAKMLVWPKVKLQPGESQERTFTIQVVSKISPMATGTSHRGSFDCRMDNTFGNTVSINVDCPTEKKIVETVAKELPRTGASENMMIAGIAFAIITYFYARSRQLKKEVRMVRHNFNAGTL